MMRPPAKLYYFCKEITSFKFRMREHNELTLLPHIIPYSTILDTNVRAYIREYVKGTGSNKFHNSNADYINIHNFSVECAERMHRFACARNQIQRCRLLPRSHSHDDNFWRSMSQSNAVDIERNASADHNLCTYIQSTHRFSVFIYMFGRNISSNAYFMCSSKAHSYVYIFSAVNCGVLASYKSTTDVNFH